MLKNWTESGKVDTLSAGAEVFFTRLIMVADDYGSYPENLQLLKSKCFPLKSEVKSAKVGEWVNELVTAGVVFKYTVDEKHYIRILDFDQRVQSKKNIYPHPTRINGESPKKTVSNGEQAPEEKRREEEVEEEEKKKEKVNGKTLEWFQGLFGEIWMDQVKMTHPGKDVHQAIKEAYLHVSVSATRMQAMDGPGAMRLVNTWLANMKSKKPVEVRKLRDMTNL